MSDDVKKDECLKILKRIAWNIQYHAKKRNRRECSMIDNFVTNSVEFDLSNFFVEQTIRNIPSKKGQYIIRRVVIEGYTEKEVAIQLNMTQQGVHKCKSKWLKVLRQQMIHSA